MAKTIDFGAHTRKMLSNRRLPNDLRIAVVTFKNQLRSGQGLRRFENNRNELPSLAAGQNFYEWQVGAAHAGDDRPAGVRRLVARVDAGGNIVDLFFTDSHYTKGEWMQLQYP
ncbi:MAG: hypothetical protein ACRDD1_07565 [Planctomycetia bacterium]